MEPRVASPELRAVQHGRVPARGRDRKVVRCCCGGRRDRRYGKPSHEGVDACTGGGASSATATLTGTTTGAPGAVTLATTGAGASVYAAPDEVGSALGDGGTGVKTATGSGWGVSDVQPTDTAGG